MPYYQAHRLNRRPYAKRSPPDLCRRASLSIRVHARARGTIRALACERGMSVSEYVARLLNDHLSYVYRVRGSLPVAEDLRL